MEWTEQLTLQFIKVYRNKEILWNPNHHYYYNKIKKNDAWNELAEEFQTTADKCKRKTSNLLSALRREKAKIKKSHGTGSGRSDAYESSWFAFKSMHFILDKNYVKAQSSINDNEVQEEISDHATPIANSSNELSGRENIQPRGTKRKGRADDPRLERAFDILNKASQSVEQQQNECDIFGILVSKKLSKYSAELQSIVQHDIMNILFRADRTHANPAIPYYNSTYLHYTTNPSNNVPEIQTVQQPPHPSVSSHSSQIEKDSLRGVASVKAM